MNRENKKRSIFKSIVWRILATLNGWIVAYLFLHNLSSSFKIAIVGNVTGFMLYYIHERVWNKIKWGIYKC